MSEQSPGVTAHPLSWPPGRPRRTAARERPKFMTLPFAVARDGLLNELRLLGAKSIVLSTNVTLRNDSLPYANQRNPDDPGVAVYFVRKGRSLCFACDRWVKVEDNMRAIADAIECIRTIERRGTGEMVDAAFTGFAALPPATPMGTKRPWCEVLGISPHAPTVDVQAAHRRLIATHHPDRGGDPAKASEINTAFDEFKQERGLA